jgi:hypothetical protein
MVIRSDLPDLAARLLSPDAPNKALVRATGRPKPTVRSWRGNRPRRRPSVAALRLVRSELQARGAACFSVMREFELEITRREGEPPRRPRGFQIVADWDGTGVLRDRRNKLGRPRKVPYAKP